MGNLYTQQFKFTGDESEITRLLEFVQTKEIAFDFAKILSIPKDSKEGEWLTRLAMYLDPICGYDKASKTYTIEFDTVTTFPEVLKVLREKFPLLKIVYGAYDYDPDNPDELTWFEYP